MGEVLTYQPGTGAISTTLLSTGSLLLSLSCARAVSHGQGLTQHPHVNYHTFNVALELLTGCFCYIEQDQAAIGPRTGRGDCSDTRSVAAEVSTAPMQYHELLAGLLN